jgi:UDP-glucuronate 4-epimerase
MMSKHILITGAVGFIGFHASQYFLKLGYNVLGIDNINDYYDPILKNQRLTILQKNNNFSFLKINLEERSTLDNALTDFQPQVILHLAAQAGVRYSIENPTSYLDSNIIGTFNLLQSIKKLGKDCKLLFASSSSIYGNNPKIPFSESDKSDAQLSLYAASKKMNESLAHAFAYETKIPVIGLRFFTVYGPWGRPDMAYFKFASLIKNGEPLTLFNKGAMSRDMTYIDDIVFGIAAAVEFSHLDQNLPYEIFNLGNNHPIPTLDLIHSIQEFYGAEAHIIHQDSQTEVENTWADISKSQANLDYQPKTKFQQGIEQFLEWHKLYFSS